MKIIGTALSGVLVVAPSIYRDDLGAFCENLESAQHG
jgi:dTDP-4-dehydrorhamnose 3,5-epimerase-like enzyme